MRHGARRAGVALVALLGCDNVERWTLPVQPDADLAFGVLYRGDDPVTIGAVVDPDVIYAGDYTLFADDDGLEARLYFFDLDALFSASERVCGEAARAIDRTACRTVVAECRTNPAGCLVAVPATAGCQDRLQLPDDLPLIAQQGPGGLLRARPGIVGDVAGVSVCGAIVRPPCPNLLPGFLMTDEEGFRCTAAATQLSCRLQIDLSDCGFGRLTADISPEGELSIVNGDCTLALAQASPAIGDAPAYALDCSGRTLVATAMTEQLVEPACVRNGPSNYETDFGFGSPRAGRIAGFETIQPDGWPLRWVMTGIGQDRCAVQGCQLRGVDCGVQCFSRCETFVLRYCALPEWPSCVGAGRRQTCIERCRAFCERAATDADGCFDVANDAMVTTSAPNAPETVGGRTPLLDDRRGPAGQQQALVRVGPPDDPILVVVGRDRVHRLRPRATVDQLTVTGTLSVGFNPAGAVVDPGRNEVVVFGTAFDAEARWARLDVSTSSPTVARSFLVPGLAEADLAAISDGQLFLTSRAPPVDTGPRRVVALDLERASRIGDWPLAEAPTAIVGVPGGRALIALTQPDGEGALGIFSPPTAVTVVSVLPGLQPKALAVDSSACDPSQCAVWVAYEPSLRDGPALIGRVFVGDEADLRFTPALTETPMDRIGLVFVDPLTRSLVSVSVHRNQILASPIAD